MKNFKNRSIIFSAVLLTAVVFSGCFTARGFAQQAELKEILVQVNPKMIELPANKATKVPVRAARIRSEDIKALNNQYNALSIEKLFKLKEKGAASSLEIKGLKATGSDTRQDVTEAIDVAHVFTVELKQGFEEKGEQAIELGNVFLVQFETDISVGQIVNSYQALEEVIFAETIIRRQ